MSWLNPRVFGSIPMFTNLTRFTRRYHIFHILQNHGLGTYITIFNPYTTPSHLIQWYIIIKNALYVWIFIHHHKEPYLTILYHTESYSASYISTSHPMLLCASPGLCQTPWQLGRSQWWRPCGGGRGVFMGFVAAL